MTIASSLSAAAIFFSPMPKQVRVITVVNGTLMPKEDERRVRRAGEGKVREGQEGRRRGG